MLSLPLLTLGLATIGAYAKPTIRVPGGLEVPLSTPANTVTPVSEIRVVVVVKNAGDDDLTIHRSGAVLGNQHPTLSFIVTKDGEDVPLTGFKVLFSADYPSENDLVTVIPAGATVTVEHNVSAVYDSSAAGPGTFTFDPVSKFQIIGIDKHIETNTPRPVSKRELLDLKKRITMDCSDKQMTKALWSGYYGARDLANTAIVNIERQGPDDPLYKQFFGSNHFVDVMANFNTIVSMDGPSNLGCDIDGKDHGNQVYSYRKFNTTSIDFYRKFFDLPDDGGLCLKAFYDPRGTRGGAMMVALGPHRGFNVDEKKIKCVDLEELTESEKFTNAVSYACYAAQAFTYIHCGRCQGLGR